ncbi:hypothetical protein [Salana multivorans]
MDTTELLEQAYRPRVIDSALQRALAAAGAVVIEGARERQDDDGAARR